MNTHLIIAANLCSLNTDTTKASSDRYELSLAKAISPYVSHISIVSHRAKDVEHFSNISLYPTPNNGSIFSTHFDDAINRYNLLASNEKNVILFWGYNPVTIEKLLRFRKNAKLVSFIYDTHMGIAESASCFKKPAINFFFKRGISKLNSCDGIILFKKEARKELRINTPCLVTLPFADTDTIKEYTPTGNSGIQFTYAGTLCDYNSIHQLVDGFTRTHLPDAHLNIFGDGKYTEFVRNASLQDYRIHYFGRVDYAVLQQKLNEADVLLNIRDTSSVVNRYAFPSKVTEYMVTGKPVMSTMVHPSHEFEKAVYMLKNNNPDEICEMFEYISSHPDTLAEKAHSAKDYLIKYHGSKKIINEMSTFLFNELFRMTD